MAGRLHRCAALVQQKYPKAVYCHCNSHALNLCVMSTSQICLMSNMCATFMEVLDNAEAARETALKLAEEFITGLPSGCSCACFGWSLSIGPLSYGNFLPVCCQLLSLRLRNLLKPAPIYLSFLQLYLKLPARVNAVSLGYGG